MSGRDLHLVVAVSLSYVVGVGLNSVGGSITASAFVVLAVLLGAILPDIIEPAIHWTHRGSFHSWLAFKYVGVILVISFILMFFTGISWIFFGVLAYGSHLALDSTTKVGLPKK